MKHCEDGLPGSSAGALLGIDVDSSERALAMHITSAFPLPRGRDDSREMEEAEDDERPDRERMEYLRTMAMLKEVCIRGGKGWHRTIRFLGSNWHGLFGGWTWVWLPGECRLQSGRVVSHHANGTLHRVRYRLWSEQRPAPHPVWHPPSPGGKSKRCFSQPTVSPQRPAVYTRMVL